MSLITSNIKGSPRMKSYLDKPGQILTAFPTTNEVRPRARRAAWLWKPRARRGRLGL